MSNNIGDIIKQLAETGEEVYSDICTVKELDLDNFTAKLSPINGKADILNVSLCAVSSSAPFLVIPKQGSTVIATYASKNTAFISLCSEVESVQIRGEEFGGLVKAGELKAQLDKLSARVDGIIDAINNGVPAVGDGGVALQTSIKILLSTIVNKESFSDLENPNVKHG
ncbi:baseplate assembly protein [uncultured Mediterranean phage uvMED]|nr:baseplate assembly protein [uncultured Mediterranean phage uvMED]BAR22571.1 baseplate assembly protein [uncultured Mediterranean phage uvMED]